MKGIVLEVNAGFAVILNEKGEFVKIKNKGFVVGQSINFRNIKPAVLKACACVALFCLVFSGAYKLSTTPVSYIDIDINPSLRLEVNTFNCVINIIPLNEDGAIVSDSVSKGRAVECVKNIITCCEQLGYLNDENSGVKIDIVSESKSLKKDIRALESNLEKKCDTISIDVYNCDKDDFIKATDNGVSMGKTRNDKEKSVSVTKPSVSKASGDVDITKPSSETPPEAKKVYPGSDKSNAVSNETVTEKNTASKKTEMTIGGAKNSFADTDAKQTDSKKAEKTPEKDADKAADEPVKSGISTSFKEKLDKKSDEISQAADEKISTDQQKKQDDLSGDAEASSKKQVNQPDKAGEEADFENNSGQGSDRISSEVLKPQNSDNKDKTEKTEQKKLDSEVEKTSEINKKSEPAIEETSKPDLIESGNRDNFAEKESVPSENERVSNDRESLPVEQKPQKTESVKPQPEAVEPAGLPSADEAETASDEPPSEPERPQSVTSPSSEPERPQNVTPTPDVGGENSPPGSGAGVPSGADRHGQSSDNRRNR